MNQRIVHVYEGQALPEGSTFVQVVEIWDVPSAQPLVTRKLYAVLVEDPEWANPKPTDG